MGRPCQLHRKLHVVRSFLTWCSSGESDITTITIDVFNANVRSKQSGVLGLYRQIWFFARGARTNYIFAMMLLASSVILKLLIPWLAAQAINTVQVSGSQEFAVAAWYVAAIFLVYVAAWAMHGPGRILERNVGLKVRQQVSDALYAKLTSLPLAWHESRHSGDVQQRAQKASKALFDFAETQFMYVQNVVNIVGPLIALWLVSGATGGVALIGYILIALAILRFDRILMQLAHRENATERRYNAGLLDFLGNISTVLSLRLQAASRALLNRRLADVFEPVRKSILVNEGKWCAVDLLSAALTWILVAVYAVMSRHDSQNAGVPVLLGGLFMIYQYAQQAGSVIGSMASNFQSFARIRTDYASADPIWEAELPVQPHATVNRGWREINARALEFTYRRGDGAHGGLREVSLTLRRGERIALIGPSGSGKSTLLRLLAGLYEPEHGYYQVDGENGFGVRSLGSVATLVPQEAEVFEASVRENLTFGATHSNDAIERAAYLSAFDSVLAALPQGLETPISERGFNLSGGQRQRLALARGFLAADVEGAHDNSLLLLDEPTSALDQVSEARIFRRLRERLPEACVIASVHRMSVLAQFDKVVLMQDGRILDCGTANELRLRQPLMRQMMEGAEALKGAA